MNFNQILENWFGQAPPGGNEYLYYLWRILASSLVTYLYIFLLAYILMWAIGRPMISWLRQRKLRAQNADWSVREDTPESHQAKQGTPSMGGIGIVGAALTANIVGFVLWHVFSVWTMYQFTPLPAERNIGVSILKLVSPGVSYLILPLSFTFLIYAILGYVDDWSKASKRGGLSSRVKFLWQIILSVFVLLSINFILDAAKAKLARQSVNAGSGLMEIPVEILPLVLWSIALIIIIVGTSNATNLTDGIDGLAAGLTVISGIALCLAQFMSSWAGEPRAFNFLPIAALSGACLGFLKFNRHPAQVFMGDTGSLAIGAALATAAIMMGAVWLLPFVGFIFYVEMFSVVLQVLWFKWTKRKTGEGQRLFRRAPLHHHFELAGWSEWRVVLTFWGVNLFTTIIGLMLWHLKILPRWP